MMATHVKMTCDHTPKNAGSYLQLEKASGSLQGNLQKEYSPAKTFVLGFLAFRTTRQQIFVVLSHRFCGNFPQQQQETNTRSEMFDLVVQHYCEQ